MNAIELISNADDMDAIEWDDAADLVSTLGPSYRHLLPEIEEVLAASNYSDASKTLALLALAGIEGFDSEIYRSALSRLTNSPSRELRAIAWIGRLFSRSRD